MRCFYAPETRAHDPQFRLTHGRVVTNAERAERATLLQEGLGRLGLTTETPPEAPRAALEAVHTARFLDFLETGWQAWQKLPNAGPEVVPNAFPRVPYASYPEAVTARAGWHMSDTSAPIGPESWTATRRAADCGVAAARAVAEGAPAAYALCRPPGHHTTADAAGGHCLLNVSAIAAAELRQHHDRIAILDIDVHHGNGTQDIFYDRADVLTVSMHAETHDYYPFFTGYAHETGTGAGTGYNLNLPLPRSTRDAGWLQALDRALERISDYAPEALVLSLGLDAHENDPLDGMKVSFDGFAEAGRRIAAAGYPVVIVQEGGYLSPDLSTSLASFLGGFLGKDTGAA
ncbi:histone deacetylase family protein [Salipiger marinus]|uniref:histone deacetylase family protein n=1 Tax=Salipiger marinus TaxID=555512 RepID=UPI001E34474B|nr:histone deacetylase family protein [Salipiger manganoxidans]MCD1620635.1 histone deacetylase family protein [Salipiger manganoxidans]MEB3420970.1 histone deacetylase family protein [Salipiger manganoxidans]